MTLKLKDDTVKLNGLDTSMLKAMLAIDQIWREFGMSEFVVTSAIDSTHKPGSLHYSGKAIDIRSRNVPDVFGMADELRHELGDDYDVVVEPDHIHIEYDPQS